MSEASKYRLSDLFNIEEIQKIQDAFAESTGIATVITDVEGKPITRPSRFCRLCSDVIRKTEKGLQKCMQSDAELGTYSNKGPVVRPCLSGGLWDGGTSINVGNVVVAKWLIGQVILVEEDNPDELLKYADEIGASRLDFQEALCEVPRMTRAQFNSICNFLYLLARQLSEIAHKNAIQAEELADRIKAEREKDDAYTNINRILEVLPAGMILVGQDNQIRKVNAMALQMLQANSTHDVIGKLYTDFFIKDKNERNGDAIVKEKEATLRTITHHEYSILRSIVKTIYQNEEVTIHLFIDISDMKVIQQALRESEERLSLAMEVTNTGMWDWRVEKNMIFFSARWYIMHGFRPDEVGTSIESWLDLQHPDDVRKINQAYYLHRKGRTPDYSIEHRSKTKSGELIWLLSTGRIVERNKDGGAVRVIGTSTNIQQRKHLEEERHNMQKKLVDTARQAGMAEVATNVLHNVGNILNSINISAKMFQTKMEKSRVQNMAKIAEIIDTHKSDLGEFLSKDEKGKLIPGYISMLSRELLAEREDILVTVNELNKNIYHVTRIIEMQQAFSKSSSFLELLDVEIFIDDALAMSQESIDKRNIILKRNYQKLPQLMVDKHKVMQIVVNLIRNSISALEDTGRKDNKILEVSLLKNERNMLQISVKDNGVGINKENMTKIFTYGFTTKRDGHGFGLHGAANSAQEMSGSLRVESEGPGQGATFILEIPYKPESSRG